MRGSEQPAPRRTRATLPVLAVSMTLAIGLTTPTASIAADTGTQATAERVFTADIPAGRLSDTVLILSRQSGVAVALTSTTDIATPAVRGQTSLADALHRLVGSNLPYRITPQGVIIGTVAPSNSRAENTVLAPIYVADSAGQIVLDTDSPGRSVFGEQAIGRLRTGGGDSLRVLRVLPNVTVSDDDHRVTTGSEQDLTPEAVSISGSRVDANAILLDGMNNRSVHQSTSESGDEANAEEIGISNPMAAFVHSDVLEEVAVYDSGIPVAYGGFTGGVIDMRTRAPAKEFGGSVGYMHQSDAFVDYSRHYNPAPGESGPRPPSFEKRNYTVSVDAPITDRLRTLFAGSRQTSKLERHASDDYAADAVGSTRSMRASYLAAAAYDISDATTLNVKGYYAPYASEFTRDNAYGDMQETTGDAFSTQVGLTHAGQEWHGTVALSYGESGYAREAPSDGFLWSSVGDKSGLCSRGTCTEGGFGDIEDTQQDVQLKGDVGVEIIDTLLTVGADYKRTRATAVREEDAYFYNSPTTGADVVCANPGDPACIDGQQALTRRQVRGARNTDLKVQTLGLWLQADHTLPTIDTLGVVESIDLRAGVRADWDDFGNDINIAPRLSGTLNFPHAVKLTLGAARYYGGDALGYALHANRPPMTMQRRTATVDASGNRVFDTDWTTYFTSSAAQYASTDVDTPYSDERMAALSLPVLEGTARVKYIQRETRDEISRSAVTAADGSRYYLPNNDGWSDYESVSLEWEKTFVNHALLLNATWSDTKRNSYRAFEQTAEDAAEPVYYDGNLRDSTELSTIATNFAQPWVFNASWTSLWLDGDLTTTLTGKYRLSRDDIVDSGENIRINGVNYDRYEKRRLKSQLTLDANASYVIDTWGTQQLELVGYAQNILGSRTHTATESSPYERGRAFWFGVNYSW